MIKFATKVPAKQLNPPAELAIIAFSTLLLFGICQKLRLWIALQQLATPSPFFSFQAQSSWTFYAGLWGDLCLAAWCACGVWLLAWGFSRLTTESRWHTPLRVGYLAFIHLALLATALAATGHHKVIFEMQSGLTYDLLREANSALTASAFWTFLQPMDGVFLLLPVGLLWGLLLAPASWRGWRNRTTALAAIAIIALEVALASGSAAALHPVIATPPIQFLATDFVRSHSPQSDEPILPSSPSQQRLTPTQRPLAKATKALVKPAPKSPYPTPTDQRHALRLFGPLFAHPGQPAKDLLPQAPKQAWNVVVLVLESLGTRYMFDTSKGNRVPMPFMQKILKQGWYFDQHFSTANSSPRSLFSIFSGLYPIPQFDMFVMRKDAKVPTLASFLPDKYNKFLITPGGLFWYFPEHFLRNSGIPELIGARSKPLRRIKKFGSFPNEIDVTSYLIKRINEAPEPFFASYMSFIPHGPYDDYGPKYRILPNVKKNFHRYINNLNVLDQQLQRVFQALETSGRMKRTIVVMVGDHGQAFWQHRYNFGHSRKSFNENYHAPLFFYQPKLFSPKTWHRQTSHVDILPTLLDALQRPYNPNLLQGESLFQSKFARKQIFLFGNEQTLSSMRPEGPKLQYSLKRRHCWVYDLKDDPEEKKKLRCQEHSEQYQALRQFLKQQKGLISTYHRTCQQNKDFFGQRHPKPRPAPQSETRPKAR